LEFEKPAMAFANAWNSPPRISGLNATETLMRKTWPELLAPLPEFQGPSRAYAMTYRVHQEEVRQKKIFSFEKRTQAESAWLPIQHRQTLDYEAEIALLLHRSEPERFGFLLANDLTDRAAQVRNFDRDNPAPGFSAAKSFPGALRVGPLLAIGGPKLWPELEVELRVNGELRQHVKARNCLLAPHEFHKQAFMSGDANEWALVLAGTTGGTIFRSPNPAEKMLLFVMSALSTRRAREAWLRRFQFLAVGDRLEMTSKILGTSHATIVATTE
jgi:2-keto-4-pentenoate hydratase/2-oxohepta-3-ene-1,7-dioic acid hydratase in catechol pathway